MAGFGDWAAGGDGGINGARDFDPPMKVGAGAAVLDPACGASDEGATMIADFELLRMAGAVNGDADAGWSATCPGSGSVAAAGPGLTDGAAGRLRTSAKTYWCEPSVSCSKR